MDNETLIHIVADAARRQTEGSATTTPAWSTDVLERALLTMAGDYLEAATALQATVSAPVAASPAPVPVSPSTAPVSPTPVPADPVASVPDAAPATTSTDTAAS